MRLTIISIAVRNACWQIGHEWLAANQNKGKS